uniref:Uncharacterized protein n=1 Tax=Cannabis sativa TaxID=3483 RepID=A0A803QZ17_CANSA
MSFSLLLTRCLFQFTCMAKGQKLKGITMPARILAVVRLKYLLRLQETELILMAVNCLPLTRIQALTETI